jgi:hypothetical protein
MEATDTQLVTTPEKTPAPIAQASRAPIAANDRGVSFSSFADMKQFCITVVNSGQFKGIETPEQAVIILQAGLELGLSPIWALTNIMVTNGRPSVWGDGLLGLVLAHPQCEDVIETNTGAIEDESYTARCEVRRKGREPIIREFSVKDAKKAGIFGKNVHAQYPKRMLQMRARAFACRDAFADALRGLGVREELENITEPKRTSGRVVSREMSLEDSEVSA